MVQNSYVLIKRTNISKLYDDLNRPDVLILLGARQVGKTTLMKELEKHAQARGIKTRYFNLEFPEDLLFFNRTDIEIFKELSKDKNVILLIDEFHYLKNASKIFKGLYDLKKGIKIVASGSSSIEIHKHLKESLAGRRNIFHIFPFNRDEMALAKKTEEEMLTFGGLPGLLIKETREDKMEYLSQMIQAYILKDIKGLIKEENVRAFNHLIFYLAEHQGSVLPTSSLSNEIGLSAKTVERYLEILEHTFVLYSVASYSKKMANELKKSKKYYLYDLGIRNSFLKDFSPPNDREDLGVIRETHVLHELKVQQRANVEIRFWNTKQQDEVDFLWIEDRIPVPIEVKTKMINQRIPPGLLKFIRNYPKTKNAYVLCEDREETVQVSLLTQIHFTKKLPKF